MAEIVLVTGGSRSGKSRFAEEYVLESAQAPAYVATGIPFDEEMKQRVMEHKSRRVDRWTNYEAPADISGIINQLSKHDMILLDCLTMLIFNRMYQIEKNYEHLTRNRRMEIEERVLDHVRKTLEMLRDMNGTFVFVTNEIGLGIVPENAMSRLYRDIVGRANQLVAEHAEDVFFVVSGIPVRIKGKQL